MIRGFRARNKLRFVYGTFKLDKFKAFKASKWERVNVFVCYWILGLISESIYSSYVYSEKAEDIWTALYDTYNKFDGSVIFNVYQQINSLKQNESSLFDYFNILKSLWKEFDGLTSLSACNCEAATKLSDHSKLMKLMQFLSGLDDTYGQVKISYSVNKSSSKC